METKFQIKVVHDWKVLVELNRLAGKTVRKWQMRLMRAFVLAAGTLAFVAGVMMIAGGQLDVQSIVNIAVGIVFLLLGIFPYQVNAWGSNRNMVNKFKEGIISFTEEAMVLESQLGSSNYFYGIVSDLYRSRGYFFLFVDKRHSYILPESGFVLGSPAEFPAFIEGKCGKEMKVIR